MADAETLIASWERVLELLGREIMKYFVPPPGVDTPVA